jgi:pyruvate, orthophosphate dikinase
VTRSVYFFGNGAADGTRDMKAVLGGKGANLAEMVNLGVPVPPGFTIACSQCLEYLAHGGVSDALRAEVDQALARLEEAAGKRFGDPALPLLVSVRSGAPVSMPGMMETILNLGLNRETTEGLARASANPRFAWDSYRDSSRCTATSCCTSPSSSSSICSRPSASPRTPRPTPISMPSRSRLADGVSRSRGTHHGSPFPTNPREQLWGAIEAVWHSWTLKKAVDYRRVNGFPTPSGPA